MKSKRSENSIDCLYKTVNSGSSGVAIVGSNPSRSAETTEPFCKSTKSRKTIDSWLDGIDVDPIFINIVNRVTPNNRQLRITEIREAIPELKQLVSGYNKIIAVGGTAARALDIAGLDHFKAPHPSGLNRFWNDKERAAEMIKEIRDYVR